MELIVDGIGETVTASFKATAPHLLARGDHADSSGERLRHDERDN
jgi:hypothetical protein